MQCSRALPGSQAWRSSSSSYDKPSSSTTIFRRLASMIAPAIATISAPPNSRNISGGLAPSIRLTACSTASFCGVNHLHRCQSATHPIRRITAKKGTRYCRGRRCYQCPFRQAPASHCQNLSLLDVRSQVLPKSAVRTSLARVEYRRSVCLFQRQQQLLQLQLFEQKAFMVDKPASKALIIDSVTEDG